MSYLVISPNTYSMPFLTHIIATINGLGRLDLQLKTEFSDVLCAQDA
jgi:hypothetical protein